MPINPVRLGNVNFGALSNYQVQVGLDLEIQATELKIKSLNDRMKSPDTSANKRAELETLLKYEHEKLNFLKNKRNCGADNNCERISTLERQPQTDVVNLGFAPKDDDSRSGNLPPVGCDLPEQGGISGNSPQNKSPLSKLGIHVGCDLPQQGGISGNLNNKDKNPFVCYMA